MSVGGGQEIRRHMRGSNEIPGQTRSSMHNVAAPVGYPGTGMQYYSMTPAPFYQDGSHVETMPYMLPYGAYQPPPFMTAPQYHSHQFAHNRDITEFGPPSTYAPSTPPTKKLRTDMRSSSAKSKDVLRRDVSKRTPSKHSPGRRTFSDFRISRIEIGSWITTETKEDQESRDSRIRFCFRNPSDKDADSTLSATEAALVTPDRISISVARGTRRIVIPAHHIKNVEFRRSAGEIMIETDGWAAFEHGTNVVSHEKEQDPSPGKAGHSSSATTWSLTEEDFTGGQLGTAKLIKIRLDQERPLTEPKWTRGSLTDHVDVNSRFLKILKLVDVETTPDLDSFFANWANYDAERATFIKSLLTAGQLKSLLTGLMSASNILTPAIRLLIDGLLSMVQTSGVPEQEIVNLLKVAVIQIPGHMLTKSLDVFYEEFLATETSHTQHTMVSTPDGYMGGSKRQRGESEVPSEQLARTTLDEKRRRLSENDPQPVNRHAHIREQVKQISQQDDQYQVVSTAVSGMHINEATEAFHESETDDGARMSREEMLRTLEDYEDQLSSPEPGLAREVEDDEVVEEEEEEDGPVESDSLFINELGLHSQDQ